MKYDGMNVIICKINEETQKTQVLHAIGLSRFVHKRSAGANAQIMSPAHRHAKLKAYVLYREMCL